jgi:prepilin-type N-terminal cleavage/methylation domain-containing protein
MVARATARQRRDRGESLIEVLVAMSIMSIAVVGVVGALVTALDASQLHRKRVTAAAAVRAYAEALQGRTTQTPTGYWDSTCPTAATYTGIYSPPAGFNARVVEVRRWDGTAFVTTCPADQGVQQVTLIVESTTDTRVSETLAVVIRKPCRTTDSACA